jgi:hypothetical protein
MAMVFHLSAATLVLQVFRRNRLWPLWAAIGAVLEEKSLPARALGALQGFTVLVNELDSGTDELALEELGTVLAAKGDQAEVREIAQGAIGSRRRAVETRLAVFADASRLGFEKGLPLLIHSAISAEADISAIRRRFNGAYLIAIPRRLSAIGGSGVS